jgi:hypothetical protein
MPTGSPAAALTDPYPGPEKLIYDREYSSNNGNGPFSMVDANENWRSWVGLLF